MADFDDVMDQMDDFYSEVDDTEKLRHLQRVHSRILRSVPLEPSVVTFSSLVADTKEYATGDTYLRVWSVRYVMSATSGDSKVLKPISVDELDYDHANWRAADSGEPTYWYWRAGSIGLHPTPDTSTSGGYPLLSMEVSTDETITGATVLPGHVRNFDAWIFGALENIAISRRDWEAVPAFQMKARESFSELIRIHQQRTARLNPKQTPNMGLFDVPRV